MTPTPEPLEPLDAGDEEGAAPVDLVELYEVLAWQAAVEEEAARG